MERARGKLSRWPHLAHLRSSKRPGWLQQSRRGVAERRGEKDTELEGGRAIRGLLEANAMASTFSPGMPPTGGFLQPEARCDLISPYMVHSGSRADHMQTTEGTDA